MKLHRAKLMPKQPASSACAGQRRNQAEVQISPDTFSWDAVQGLIDDWLVPMIVEQFLIGLRKGSGLD